jgi:hypothetical protein
VCTRLSSLPIHSNGGQRERYLCAERIEGPAQTVSHNNTHESLVLVCQPINGGSGSSPPKYLKINYLVLA